MTRHPAARIAAPSYDTAPCLHVGRAGATAHSWRFAGRWIGSLALACAALTGVVSPWPTGAMAASIATAIASLPPSAGRVLSVQETGAGSDFRQRITLSGGHAGANTIEIMTGAAAIAPSPAQISAELAAQFPGVAMTPLPGRVLHNAYGSMHVAIGAPNGGGRCIYAWQQVSDLSRQGPQPVRLFQRAAPASVRIRLCSLNATLDQLAETSEQLVIVMPDSASAAPAGELPAVTLSPLVEAAPETELQPRVMLAQASRRSGGALLDHSSGNPGGLIGMLRGYRRTDPIQGTRRARSSRNQASRVYSTPRQQRSSGFGERPLLSDDGSDASVNQGGLLGNWAARRRMDAGRNVQAAPRQSYTRTAPATRRQAAPQRRATPRQATSTRARARQANPQQARPQQARPPEVATQPRQPPRQQPVVQPVLPQGYQAPGNGARYLGLPPGAAPVQSAPMPAGSGASAIPAVPRPVQAAPGAVAPARPAAAQQPASPASQPVLRGLDPTLPGRAYRGPGG